MPYVVPPATALMTRSLRYGAALPLVLIACASFLLSACGGGSGGGSGAGSGGAGGDGGTPVPVTTTVLPPDPFPPDPSTPVGPVDLSQAATFYAIDPSGVGGDAGGDGGAAGGAGDGSPLARVTVTLTDVNGRQVSGKTDGNGRFLLTYKTADFVPPLVLRTIDAEGNVLASTTGESTPSGKAIRANINPLTDKITSDALIGVEGTDRPFDGSKIDLNKLTLAKSELLTSVKDALGVVGVTDTSNFDPVKSVYNYDGTGVDAVIDSISHSRYPATGATQLRVKLDPLHADVDGLINPTFVTAGEILKPGSVAVASSSALTFAKLNAWMDEMNRCLAMSSSARGADLDCVDADGSRLVSAGYKHNGKDLAETYRRLFSEADRSAIAGSALSNPSILFNAPSEGERPYDTAVVQFTVDQPRSGPRDLVDRPREFAGDDGARYPIRYTMTTVFRRDESLTRSKAGNWILYGNQANYDFNVQPSYWRGRQLNPSMQQGGFRSGFSSALEITASPNKFDPVTKRPVSADIRAVRVRGPGLPTAGLVLASPSPDIWMVGSVPGDRGATSLSPHNRRGEVSSGPMFSQNWGKNFFLASIGLDGGPGTFDFWMGTGEEVAETRLTDFSALQAYSRYSFEIFLNSNTDTSKADEIQFVRIMAPVMPPSFSADLQRNDAGTNWLLPPEIDSGTCAASLRWTNNLDAAQIDSAFMVGKGLSISRPGEVTRVLFRGPNEVARLSGVRSGGTVVGNCSAVAYMPQVLAEDSFRVIGLGSNEKRSRIWELSGWTSGPAPTLAQTP